MSHAQPPPTAILLISDMFQHRFTVRSVLWITLAIAAFFLGRASAVMRLPSAYFQREQLHSVSSIQRATMENHRRRIAQLEQEKLAVELLAQKLRAQDSATLDDWLQREAAIVPRVTAVTDGGETLVVATGEKESRVRIDGIECPDSGHPLAARSLSFVTDLCFGREVTLVDKGGRDGRGGMRADVSVNGVSVSRELLRAGLARRPRPGGDDSELDYLETQARQDELGLWAEGNAATPWEARDR